ncbi:hypothetical protein E2C01_101683 [Portunus trituberculatus]|uniref:Uncharacterized protein n=1 Tax=Portunus trituberculatus TaxID=210409 RepID=A0A5B7KAD2_PORTR|nr:hypothetical protein [Portunus trituberculatus]
MDPGDTLAPRASRRRLTLHSILILLLVTKSTAASSRRLNSRFLDLTRSEYSNYTRIYRALDEGMRDPRRLDEAFRSVDHGRALNVFDVARAIVPGKRCDGDKVIFPFLTWHYSFFFFFYVEKRARLYHYESGGM